MSNKSFFIKYILNNFDVKIPEIKGKLKHSIAVAKISKKLAKKLKLDYNLAYNIGLLHDIGRFKQFTDYKTFDDYKSVDHGKYACELLFKDNFIKNFKIQEKDYPIVNFAILNHNKNFVNCEEIKKYISETNTTIPYQDFINYCNLIRDTDKIHNFKRQATEKRTITKKPNGLSPEIQKDIDNLANIKLECCQTKLDDLLFMLSQFYDINFLESFALFNYKKRIEGMKKIYLNQVNKKDQKVFLDQIEILKNYLFKKLGY